MKNVVLVMFVTCAMTAAIGLAAQGEPASRSPQQPAIDAPPAAVQPQAPVAPAAGEPSGQRAPASPRPAQNVVTMSGCIQSAPARPGVASSPSDAKFVLANVKSASGANAAVGTTGTTETAAGYRLQGDEKALSPHLNHQVEITGTVQPGSASEAGAASARPGSAAASPTLKVDSVKMVSAKCQ